MSLAVKVFNCIFHGRIKHMIRFSIVGVSNTIIDFLAFTMLFSVLGLGYIPSQILGYSAGILNSFVFNKKWTFGDNNKPDKKIGKKLEKRTESKPEKRTESKPEKRTEKKTAYEFVQFVVINVISLSASVIGMDLLVRYVNVNVFLSKILVILISQIINFLSYKLWVFSPRKSVTA